MTKRDNLRHELFAEHYAKSGNGTQSAIAAGYSRNGAHVTAIRLLRNPTVQQHILRLRDATREEAIADIRELQEWWTKIMRNERDIPPEFLEGLTSREAALKRWQLGYTIKEQLRASELLGKSIGAFIQPIEPVTIVRVVYVDEAPNAPPIDVTPTRKFFPR
jgi:phage terminase small subunit